MPVALAERQLFAEGGFVNLDNANAVLFEVQDFVADGKADFLCLHLQRNVFARERPVENRHRAREHAFYRFLGAALCVYGPFDGNRSATAYVSPNYRRLHAASAIALHPGILRKNKSVNLRAEIFHHVVAFKFTVYNHVEADFFLQLDAFGNFFAVEFYVLFLGNFTLAECGAVRADFSRLRERSDGSRGECGQLEFSLLHFAALEAARLAFEISGGEGGQFRLHLGVRLHTRRCKQGLILFESGSITACNFGKFSKFNEFFFGEGKVTERLGGEFLFGCNRVRHVQQRTRSSDHHVFGTDSLFDFSEQGVLLCVIGTPDVLAVHDTGEQKRIFRETRLDQFQRFGAFHKIETDGIETESDHILVHIADIAKVSLQGNLEACGTHLLDKFHINRLEKFFFFGGHVKHQSGFGEADPFGTSSGEQFGNLRISSDCRGYKILCLLFAVVAGQAEERISANQSRHSLKSSSFCFVVFLHRLGTFYLEFGGVVNFGNNVVVVRVEPLLHREGLYVALFSLVTMGRGEILFEIAKLEFLVTFWNNAEQERRIEHVVVEREIVRRNKVDAGGLLLCPTVLTNFGGDVLELRFGDLALEELFAGELEFTGLTNARETDYRCFLIAHSVFTYLFCLFFDYAAKYISFFIIGKILFFMQSP